MIEPVRSQFLAQFTEEKYQNLLLGIYNKYKHKTPFRIAETPVFIPNDLKEKLYDACREINLIICQPNFKEITQNAIHHAELPVPGEDYHTRFLQMDFGICKDNEGNVYPKLIEIQGFPSLYFFQDLISKAYQYYFDIPENFSVYLDGLDSESYLALLRKIIVGDNDPKNVILLEVEPEKQVTRIDFLGAEDHLGIKVLCISQLKKSGRDLYYIDDYGKNIPVYKIYNRVIFDELRKRTDLKREFYFKDEVDVEWVGHPNWFFRISKYTLPLLKSQYVPESYYLSQLEEYPDDLQNYVLKPLYSFAGKGVSLNINREDLDGIQDRENYILQRKIKYEPVIRTKTEPSKCEIRMLMVWGKEQTTARIVNNLARLSKGEMIGVRYNKDKDWVGASVGFFER